MRVLPLLLAVALACAAGALGQESPDRRVSCVPCRADERPARCPPVRPQQCRSRQLTRCGCCDTCLVYIADGDFCTGALPTNGVCRAPMSCVGNLCRNPGA